MKTQLLIATFLLGLLHSFGQTFTSEQIKNRYDSAAIYPYSHSRFKVNDKILKRKELRTLLLSYPQSAQQYKLYKKKKMISDILGYSSLGVYAASLLTLGADPDVSIGLLAGGAVIAIGSIPPAIHAERALHKAVWQYNRAILSGDKKTPEDKP